MPAYYVARGAGSDGQKFVVGVNSTVRNPSAFPFGLFAETTDRSLAEQIASKLNEIDPRPRPRVMRGMGWW
jgi:hypothetical protein